MMPIRPHAPSGGAEKEPTTKRIFRAHRRRREENVKRKVRFESKARAANTHYRIAKSRRRKIIPDIRRLLINFGFESAKSQINLLLRPAYSYLCKT